MKKSILTILLAFALTFMVGNATAVNYSKSVLQVDSLAINLAPVELSAAKTITAAENGTVFILTGVVGYAVTLPSPAAGLNYTIIVQDLFATTDWVLTAATAVLYGTVMEAGVVQLVAADTTINLELATDTIGDYLYVFSDGTNWYVRGSTSQAASVTPA